MTVHGTERLSPVGITPLSDSVGTPKILMCPPEFFDVTYVINPWMKQTNADGSVQHAICDVPLAKKQWEKLYQTISNETEAEVLLMDPVEGLPDLVFTANAAFVYENTAIIAHYKHEERQGEEPHAEAWFRKQGFKTVTLPHETFFEGAGDALTWKKQVFAGYKTRTDIDSHNLITRETGLPVLSMELIDSRFYHIDVCICPLNRDFFIYSPAAFDAYGNTVIEANIPEEKRIIVTPEEAARFACNSVSIYDTVIFNEGSHRLAGELTDRGFRVLQVDLSEFLKSGGSAKCLTLRVA